MIKNTDKHVTVGDVHSLNEIAKKIYDTEEIKEYQLEDRKSVV